MSEVFDAKAVGDRLNAEAKIRRKKSSYAQRKSILDAYKAELLALDAGGYNGTRLQTWLSQEHKLDVERSTINRWLHKNRVKNG